MAKCASCGKEYKKYKSTQKVCSITCALQYQLDNPKEKESFVEKIREQQWKQEKRQIKAKLKTLSELEAEAKRAFQKWIRMRDFDRTCISCGTKVAPIWDGGHFYPAGKYSKIIFEEMNCHKQCRRCNHFLSGNETEYRKGLLERYGKLYLDTLDDMALKGRDYRWTREELIAIRQKYNKKIRLDFQHITEFNK